MQLAPQVCIGGNDQAEIVACALSSSGQTSVTVTTTAAKARQYDNLYAWVGLTGCFPRGGTRSKSGYVLG